MFPKSHNLVAQSLKLEVDPLIASHISVKAEPPESCIRLRARHVFRASMPEAAVDEDSYSSGDEQQIRSTWQAGMQDVAMPCFPQGFAKPNFRPSIRSSNTCHATAPLLRCHYVHSEHRGLGGFCRILWQGKPDFGSKSESGRIYVDSVGLNTIGEFPQHVQNRAREVLRAL